MNQNDGRQKALTIYILIALSLTLPLVGYRVLFSPKAAPLTPPLTPPITPFITVHPTITPQITPKLTPKTTSTISPRLTPTPASNKLKIILPNSKSIISLQKYTNIVWESSPNIVSVKFTLKNNRGQSLLISNTTNKATTNILRWFVVLPSSMSLNSDFKIVAKAVDNKGKTYQVESEQFKIIKSVIIQPSRTPVPTRFWLHPF